MFSHHLITMQCSTLLALKIFTLCPHLVSVPIVPTGHLIILSYINCFIFALLNFTLIAVLVPNSSRSHSIKKDYSRVFTMLLNLPQNRCVLLHKLKDPNIISFSLIPIGSLFFFPKCTQQ